MLHKLEAFAVDFCQKYASGAYHAARASAFDGEAVGTQSFNNIFKGYAIAGCGGFFFCSFNYAGCKTLWEPEALSDYRVVAGSAPAKCIDQQAERIVGFRNIVDADFRPRFYVP